ncbi:MAG: sensor histidine kinase [Eggerthellaceae bacterium]|nr:sensor histidine kinase [Eggerthellaceae bacterium]
MIFRNKVANPSAINLDQLFERFYQVDSARSSDGSGLGLAIVASLVKRMEGKISVQILSDELVIELKLKYPKEPKVPN